MITFLAIVFLSLTALGGTGPLRVRTKSWTVQIELTYNSNHLKGSRLTHDQARFIFETNTVGITNERKSIPPNCVSYSLEGMEHNSTRRDALYLYTKPEEVIIKKGHHTSSSSLWLIM